MGLTATGDAPPPVAPIPAAAAALLERARAAWHQPAAATALLGEALALAPQCLALHYARYKFHSSHGQYALAEAAARTALAEAARQAGFDADWRALGPASADWSDVRGPAHFYLFSLKALAYLRLRRGALQDCLALLDKLRQLDPADQVGAGVIRDLYRGAVGDAA